MFNDNFSSFSKQMDNRLAQITVFIIDICYLIFLFFYNESIFLTLPFLLQYRVFSKQRSRLDDKDFKGSKSYWKFKVCAIAIIAIGSILISFIPGIPRVFSINITIICGLLAVADSLGIILFYHTDDGETS